MKIELPVKVNNIIEELRQHGFDAYAVGGCVRDSIMGRTPKDWDVTTSASPLQVKDIFPRTIDTGIQHGTVTVMDGKEGFEVTTYRIDGEYEDNRHPKQVEFTNNLIEDLKRRDFTMNAMAYNRSVGLVDEFNGLKDIENKQIRCVGSAAERFDEDALRILRAVRFSAQLDFNIEEETLKAVVDKAENLKNISAERIREELNNLLLSDHPEKMITCYETKISRIVLPEFDDLMIRRLPGQKQTLGYLQMKALRELKKLSFSYMKKEQLMLHWAVLLQGVNGGAEQANETLKRLKFDNETMDMVTLLVSWADCNLELTPAGIRKAVNKLGTKAMELLFIIKQVDCIAADWETKKEELNKLHLAQEIYQEIINKKECIHLKMLAINGADLIKEGYQQGKGLGELLEKLLLEVLENPELNEKQTLLHLARQIEETK